MLNIYSKDNLVIKLICKKNKIIKVYDLYVLTKKGNLNE